VCRLGAGYLLTWLPRLQAHQDDIETLILWLSNTCRFLHLLKQYSGEKSFQVFPLLV